MSEQLRSLRHERDIREHGAAVTTRPWWNAPGEESLESPRAGNMANTHAELSMSMLVRKPDSWPFS